MIKHYFKHWRLPLIPVRTVRRTKQKVPRNNSSHMGNNDQQSDKTIFNFTNLNLNKERPDQKKQKKKTRTKQCMLTTSELL